MKNHKNKIRISFFVCFFSILLFTLIYFVVFLHSNRSMLIDFSSFKQNDHLYYDSKTPQSKIDSLKYLVNKATVLTSSFFGHKISPPKIIYCYKLADFKKYCNNPTNPAATYMNWSTTIVLRADALDLDIIAHELTHTELYNQVGFYNWNVKIPTWFDEGLAMQNDGRNYYSDDTLRIKSDNFKNLPDLTKLNTNSKFSAGSNDKIMLNYMTAKHEILKWYTKDKLILFIKNLHSGKSFEEAYNN